MDEGTTDSHALAAESAARPGEEGGIAQEQLPQHPAQPDTLEEQPDVKDAGWKDNSWPVVEGVPPELMSILLRRFDNQIFHVQQIEDEPLANLDLNNTEHAEFSPVKLRANLERFYTSVVVQVFALGTHIARLRSWNESHRTGTFLAVYLVAWLVDALVPVSIAFLMALILFPRLRTVCFPPVPATLVSKASSTEAARNDTLTDTEERHEGEGVEAEAHTLLNSVATLLLSTTAGKHSSKETDSEPPDINAPDLTDLQVETQQAETDKVAKSHLRARLKVSQAVWDKAAVAMRILTSATDNWERGANALSPTPPFDSVRPRITLAACLGVPLLGSCFITSYMLVKGLQFAVGFLLFGEPLIDRGTELVKRHFPEIVAYLEPRNFILRGVPTNAQLALTLLRVGERSRVPIPPPQDSDASSQADPKAIPEASKKQKQGRGRFMRFIRGVTGGSIKAYLSVDAVKAAAGERHAQKRMGVVQPTKDSAGPVSFPARYKGQKGHAYITITATSPALSWAANPGTQPVWSVPIADIREATKVGGLGWKSKMVVNWALEKQVIDGLVVRTNEGEHHLTAVVMRDELFNRILSAGPQMWEAL